MGIPVRAPRVPVNRYAKQGQKLAKKNARMMERLKSQRQAKNEAHRPKRADAR